jgi:hypothetical protein
MMGMAYCPECLCEYREGIRECADCRVPLQPGSPPADASGQTKAEEDQLVQVRVFSGATAQIDAELARSILEKEGIPCILAGEASAALLPFLSVPLLVREADAERAAELLKSYWDSAEALPPE